MLIHMFIEEIALNASSFFHIIKDVDIRGTYVSVFEGKSRVYQIRVQILNLQWSEKPKLTLKGSRWHQNV